MARSFRNRKTVSSPQALSQWLRSAAWRRSPPAEMTAAARHHGRRAREGEGGRARRDRWRPGHRDRGARRGELLRGRGDEGRRQPGRRPAEQVVLGRRLEGRRRGRERRWEREDPPARTRVRHPGRGGHNREGGHLLPLWRHAARRRDVLPIVRSPYGCATDRARRADRGAARRAALLRHRDAGLLARRRGRAAPARDRPGGDRLRHRRHRRDCRRRVPRPRVRGRRAPLAGHVYRSDRRQHRRPRARRGRRRSRVGVGLDTRRPRRCAAPQGAVPAPAPARRARSGTRRLVLLRRRSRRRAEGSCEGARRADGLERPRTAASRRERAPSDAEGTRDRGRDRGDQAGAGRRRPAPKPEIAAVELLP